MSPLLDMLRFLPDVAPAGQQGHAAQGVMITLTVLRPAGPTPCASARIHGSHAMESTEAPQEEHTMGSPWAPQQPRGKPRCPGVAEPDNHCPPSRRGTTPVGCKPWVPEVPSHGVWGFFGQPAPSAPQRGLSTFSSSLLCSVGRYSPLGMGCATLVHLLGQLFLGAC